MAISTRLGFIASAASIVLAAIAAQRVGAQPDDRQPDEPMARTAIDDVTADVSQGIVDLLGGVAYDVGFVDGSITDASRSRAIAYRLRYPKNYSGKAALVIVSHGGAGGEMGYTALAHLGSTYARFAFVALSINHLPSINEQRHRYDRPADTSFVIDAIEAGLWPGADKEAAIVRPDDFQGSIDIDHIALVGHSWGAYTAHAVGGADFAPTQGIRNFRDPRIDAIAPISPQGKSRFGAYDAGADHNTWRTITIPSYVLLGERENAAWRREPFDRYTAAGDKFLSIAAGQDHAQMGNDGTREAKAFIALNTALFFHTYLRGGHDRCQIGKVAHQPGWTLERKLDPRTGPPCRPSGG